MIGKPISGRNRETPVKGKISRERSTDRGSQAHNGGDGRYYSVLRQAGLAKEF